MSNTTRMLNAAGAGTVNSTDAGQFGTVSSGNFKNGILYPQRQKDHSGLFQVQAQGGLTGTVTLRGRLVAADAWVNVLVVTQADWDADPLKSYATAVTIFPEMMVVSNITAGAGPAISAWLSE